MSEFSEKDERLIQTMLRQRRINAEVHRRARLEDTAVQPSPVLQPTDGNDEAAMSGTSRPMTRATRPGTCRYPLVWTCEALGDEARKMHGYVGVDPEHFTLEDLLACGVSDDGVGRVLRQAQVDSTAVGEEEPGLTTRVLVHELEDLRDGVLVTVKVKGASIDVELNHDSSLSVGDVTCTPDPTEGEPPSPRPWSILASLAKGEVAR